MRKLEPLPGRILVCYEKHGNRFFDASTHEKYVAACVLIVKERLDWYKVGKPPGKPPGKPMIGDDYDKLPERFKDILRRELRKYDLEMSEWKQDKDIEDAAMNVENGKNLEDAVFVIKARSKHGYERVDLVCMESCEETP